MLKQQEHDATQNFKIQLIEKDSPEVVEVIATNLNEFNSSVVGPLTFKQFTVSVVDHKNQIIGGVYGVIFANFDCLVHIVSIEKQNRRHGLGSKMLAEVEKFARANNCTNIRLETSAFQAKGFYEKIGYSQIAEFPNGFLGHRVHVMRKIL